MTAPRIHPSAVIDRAAELADDVTVGPFAIIEAGVRLGSGCVVGPHAHLLGLLEVGANNRFHTGCVIGDNPQHLGYANEPTRVVIGTGNTFREYVTIHRGMPGAVGVTTIGNDNFLMANSHVAHDCTVHNNTIFANSAVIGGHAEIFDRAFLSGNTCVHQFCRVGRGAMVGGTSSLTLDLPPYWTIMESNMVRGVNVIGMRRAGIPSDEIMGVRRLYKAINRSGLTIRAALEKCEAEDGHLAAVREVIEFIRASKRGVCTGKGGGGDA